MDTELDRKAWRAARKAGLIVHKVRGIGRKPDLSSLFVVHIKKEKEEGMLLQLDKSWGNTLFTAEEVIKEATTHGIQQQLESLEREANERANEPRKATPLYLPRVSSYYRRAMNYPVFCHPVFWGGDGRRIRPWRVSA